MNKEIFLCAFLLQATAFCADTGARIKTKEVAWLKIASGAGCLLGLLYLEYSSLWAYAMRQRQLEIRKTPEGRLLMPLNQVIPKKAPIIVASMGLLPGFLGYLLVKSGMNDFEEITQEEEKKDKQSKKSADRYFYCDL